MLGTLMVQGSDDDYRNLNRYGLLKLPEGVTWELRGRLHDKSKEDVFISNTIRISIIILTTLLMIAMLNNSGVLGEAIKSGRGTAARHVILITMLPIILLIIAFEVYYFYTLRVSTKQLMQNKADEITHQATEHIESFFRIPRQSIFTAELFRQGILDLNRPSEMLGLFVSQLRIQPELTFLSVANTQGEYFAASRPPYGKDRNIRIQRATLETDREMQIHWAQDDNRPSRTFERGNKYFDARNTVWYKSALTSMSMQWYPVYSYGTKDSKRQYQDMGIGMSAPLFNPNNDVVGVITADISLSQLNTFLKKEAQEIRGSIFLVEQDGLLLATSSDEPLTLVEEGVPTRLMMGKSSNSIISTAASYIEKNGGSNGREFITINGSLHLMNWSPIDIPDGPTLLQVVIIPSDILSDTAFANWQDGLYIGWLILIFSSIIAMHYTKWLTSSISELERWASQLLDDKWHIQTPSPGPILEIQSLSKSLSHMVQKLHNHTLTLEEKVEQRTQELLEANLRLEQLSITDSLTGLANRRWLDDYSSRLWQQAIRRNEPLALLMVDVDFFKKYNDQYGHLAGDKTLAYVAGVLAKQVRRPDDLVARYGGEEFAILLPSTSAEAASAIATKACQDIAAQEIEHCNSPLGHITISVGVSYAYPGQEGYSLKKLFTDADAALYKAKNSGRNTLATLADSTNVT